VSMNWINFVCTWMKPLMSPIFKRALRILHSGLRRKEAAALLARVEHLVLMLAQRADGTACLADFVVPASEHEPPTLEDCSDAAHGITTGLSPTEAAENDKHL
jgi:hypothetical protein